MLLPDAPRRFGLLRNGRAARRRVDKILAELDLEDIDPETEVHELDLSIRQKIEIARAISRKPRILLLDEPSAALSAQDVEWLGERIALLHKAGVTIILVTHRIQEVRAYCSRLSVLRSGRHIGTYETGTVSDSEVFSLIMGRTVEAAFPHRASLAHGPEDTTLLEVQQLSIGHRLRDVSLRIAPGEILGVAALQGMGQLELFNGLFGVERLDGGRLFVTGREVWLSSPRDAIRAGLGVGLVPEDRKIQGLALTMTGSENASLASLDRFTRFGWIDKRREATVVDEAFTKLQVHPRALHQTAGSFSGGNQQKIVLAKWMLTECKVLLVFDPTRGVDVGTKHDMYILLRQFADDGGAVLFYSTEVPELVGLADRVIVLYRGQCRAELCGADINEDAIGRDMLGADGRVNETPAEAVS
jgi:ribose transport system ATP-binding protein